jgi:cell division protease FtsH
VGKNFKTILVWLVVGVALILLFRNHMPGENATNLSYTEFVKTLQQGKVQSVVIENQQIRGTLKGATAKEQTEFTSYIPMSDPSLLAELDKQQVNVVGQPPEPPGFLMTLLMNFGPIILLVAFWIFMMRQMQGGGGGKGGPMSFGRSKAKLLGEDQIKVTFKDVAGVLEAKQEVEELVDFLRDPSKFQKLGGRIPCGVLLVGSPGTGKTLLAKAVAGEAKVPFFTISGSDFVEMFVGVGASRVRDMFEQAKKQAPCIIFIDEIDAVGRHRGAGVGGGHDEREQTLNQLLVEMDGFGGNEGVIVMAATNRPDVLDPALLRPGRFDRQVVVPLPDILGREEILRVHMRKVPLDTDVDPSLIARGTPGFSGADLANLVNEAALFAARAGKKIVDMLDMEKAKDKLIMGSERRSMVMSEDEKRLTAYHEAGHAIVGLNMPDHDPVYKVSIIPRGRALGVTMFLPEGDRYSYSKRRLYSQVSSLYGGRLAETIIFGEDAVTTGASNDIERATELCRNMVTKWGLSQKMGPISYGEEEGDIFLGRGGSRSKHLSDETGQQIELEIRRIADECYAKAEALLLEHMDVLHAMADTLMMYETIDESQIKDLMARKTPKPPAGWNERDIKAEKPAASKIKKTETKAAESMPGDSGVSDAHARKNAADDDSNANSSGGDKEHKDNSRADRLGSDPAGS